MLVSFDEPPNAVKVRFCVQMQWGNASVGCSDRMASMLQKTSA